jgi:hypothetical protein
MLGVVNKAIENFVITVHGGALWQQVLRSIGEPGLQFEPMLMYEDAKTYDLITALAQALGKPQIDLLDDLGTFLVTPPHGGPCAVCCDFVASALMISCYRWMI